MKPGRKMKITEISVRAYNPIIMFSLTLMAVGASESFLTLARKLASGLTPAASVRTTDI